MLSKLIACSPAQHICRVYDAVASPQNKMEQAGDLLLVLQTETSVHDVCCSYPHLRGDTTHLQGVALCVAGGLQGPGGMQAALQKQQP